MVPQGTNCALVGYSDFNFFGCKLDHKSTSSTCHLLGNSFVSQYSKKRASVVLFITEAHYVIAGCCCAYIIWMKHQLSDYKFDLAVIPMKCNITSAINLARNLILHSLAKYTEVRHHFNMDHVNKSGLYDCACVFI